MRLNMWHRLGVVAAAAWLIWALPHEVERGRDELRALTPIGNCDSVYDPDLAVSRMGYMEEMRKLGMPVSAEQARKALPSRQGEDHEACVRRIRAEAQASAPAVWAGVAFRVIAPLLAAWLAVVVALRVAAWVWAGRQVEN